MRDIKVEFAGTEAARWRGGRAFLRVVITTTLCNWNDRTGKSAALYCDAGKSTKGKCCAFDCVLCFIIFVAGFYKPHSLCGSTV